MHATAGLGLVEVHSHLIPAVDDGSRTQAESIAIARECVARGYNRLVCTPHIWPDLPHNNLPAIRKAVADLQLQLDDAGVALRLYVGGEINLREGLTEVAPDSLPTYADRGTHVLVDAWIWKWETWLTPTIRHLQQGGRTVILAHPERLGLIQDHPSQIKRFQDHGVLFQGNLYCFADAPGQPTREVAERMLDAGQYFMLGGDLHRSETLDARWRGLERVIARCGLDLVKTLLQDRPATLLGE